MNESMVKLQDLRPRGTGITFDVIVSRCPQALLQRIHGLHQKSLAQIGSAYAHMTDPEILGLDFRVQPTCQLHSPFLYLGQQVRTRDTLRESNGTNRIGLYIWAAGYQAKIQ